ncbi:MAG TPA: cation-efflux pump [Aliidongia sp.]|nr:cation-efflux pump [Aliidongia sp.]
MSHADRSNTKQLAALGSVGASGALTAAKLVVGLMTGSIGLMSEAAHSALDVGAALITYFAVRISDKPPDDDHPYGHGKVESVAALSETALLFATSLFIIYEAVRRLQMGGGEVEANWWSVGVIVASIVIDIGRSRALMRVARQTKSQALEADALHFSSDILSSAVVLVGLLLVRLGYPIADSIAAIGVAGFVCFAGWRLGRRTIDTLIDTAPAGIAERVHAIARRTPGIVKVDRVRARGVGSTLHVDIEAGVNRSLPLERVAELKLQLAGRIRSALPDAEIAVTTTAVALDDESMRERLLMIAAYHGQAIHHVTVQKLGEKLSISLDLEIDGRQSLGEAHITASELEAAIRAEFGEEIEVDTHIEPLLPEEIGGTEAPAPLTEAIAASIEAIASNYQSVIDTHDVRVRRGASGLFISFHCTFAPDQSVDFVHRTVSEIETRLRERWPDTRRIMTHAEPPEE